MESKKIEINIGDEMKISLILETNSQISEIRKKLLDEIDISFKFGDKYKTEIPKEKESEIKLKDILDGTNLFLIKRVMLGKKIESRNELDFYLYPQRKLTEEEKASSLNIMVAGEPGSGKSTWLNSFLNYLQEIQLEENDRYYLFDEKKLLDFYNKPIIYNIEPNKLINKPIRLIDTPGFDSIRGLDDGKKMIEDIRNLFQNSEIENVNAICFFFIANRRRVMYRYIHIILSLFKKEIINNIIIICTFTDNFKDIPCLKEIKNKDGPFAQMFEDINDIPYFAFDNSAYFNDDKESVEKIYEKNTSNFRNFLQCVSSLNRVSLHRKKNLVKNSI